MTNSDFDLERELAAARESIHRSIGQRVRWANKAIRTMVLTHQIEILTPQGRQAIVNAAMREIINKADFISSPARRLQCAMAAVDEFTNGPAARQRAIAQSAGNTIRFRRPIPFGVAR